MNYTVAVIPGDGVGEEIVTQAVSVLDKVASVYNHNFNYKYAVAGTAALKRGLPPMPDESLSICQNADAVLLGKVAVGNYPQLPFEERPESIVSVLRTQLSLRSDIRPAFFWEPLKAMCPLKDSVRQKGLNVLVVRDVAGGMFTSDGCRCDGDKGRAALDTELYNEQMIRDSAHLAFRLARSRLKKVTSLDKAILLSSSVLWRQVVSETSREYPDITLDHKLVDGAAQELIENPDSFDVIVTSNVFGDIIADEIAGLVGAGEILPAATLDVRQKGVYSPNQLHRPCEDIAGQNRANPVGIILASAMMLEYSFGLKKEADSVRQAVIRALYEDLATDDFWVQGKQRVSTKQMTEAIKRKIT